MDIYIKYVHLKLNIGLKDVRNVWLLEPEPVQLTVAVHRGSLVYRMPVSGKRISYRQLKKNLVKQSFVIKRLLYVSPF
jgi:hypothetical protein